MMLSAARRVATLSSSKTIAAFARASARPCLVTIRNFGAQMQVDDHDDHHEGSAQEEALKQNPASQPTKKEQLMAGYRDTLDKMMTKASNIESSMESLKNVHNQKQALRQQQRVDIKWTETAEIDRLFDEAEKHKASIAGELEELKLLLKNAAVARFDAVDAPDGESDWHIKDEMRQVRAIVDDAAVFEDPKDVVRRHQAAFQAVDAPDGESDGHVQEEMMQVQDIVNDAAALEDKEEIVRRHQATFRAVDAPDGESDGHVQEELQEIRQIIDEASAVENKKEVEYKHMMENQVQKERARDAEHDW